MIQAAFKSQFSKPNGHSQFMGISMHASTKRALGLTLSSTRTPPALPFALSQHFAIPASFIALVQAGPVSFADVLQTPIEALHHRQGQ
jgi:hypothetical protein